MPAQYELNLRDYIRILNKRKFIIIFTTIAVTCLSFLYSSKETPIYTSSSSVQIEERKTIAGLLTEWIMFNPGDIMESQTKLIKGFSLMQKVALRTGVIQKNSLIPDIHEKVNALQEKVNAEIIGRTNIIKITATEDTPTKAINLANTVAEVFVEESLLEKTKQARVARQFIEEQLAALRKRFTDTEDRLKSMEGNVKGIQLSETIQNKLAELQFQLVTLQEKYTDQYPAVLQLKEQIARMEERLGNFSGKDLEYTRLLRDVDVNKKLYVMLSEKLEEARITEAQKISDVTIVDPAVVAVPSGTPQKEMGLVLGLLMGLVLGSVVAFVLETMDTSIRTMEDIETVIKLQVLGLVPSVLAESKTKNDLLRFKIARKFFTIQSPKAEEKFVRLVTHWSPNSNVAEAYRNIRTNLRLEPNHRTILLTSAAPGEGKTTVAINMALVIAQTGAKTLLVSSDLRRPSIERTFGLKKEPGFTDVVLGVTGDKQAIRNISDMLLGGMLGVDEILKTPGIENLSILTCGHIPSNPAEILESRNAIRLIQELKDMFDVILFDSPPVLPITDANLLASKVDQVIILYEIGKTSREALLRTKIQLESVGAKISGVILNQIQPQIDSVPYSYYKYSYRKYYTQAEENVSAEAHQEIKS